MTNDDRPRRHTEAQLRGTSLALGVMAQRIQSVEPNRMTDAQRAELHDALGELHALASRFAKLAQRVGGN